MPPARPAAPLRFRPFAGGLLLAGLGALVLAAYANSFAVPFLFDDLPSIVENPSIRRLSALDEILMPPVGEGLTVGGRPLLNLSFALNHALGGLNPWGYHGVNLAIHGLAGLFLFLVVRATFARPAPAADIRAVRRGWALGPWSDAEMLAAVVTAWWWLHPLQTAAVTYVVQRAESLAGLFYLLALWGLIRAAGGARPLLPLALTWLACLLGMLTKEVVATAPLVLLLYDRTFLAGSFRAAWRLRWKLHLALMANWLVLAWLVLGAAGRGGSAGFGTPAAAWPYLLTQAGAIWHYLRLAVWPHPLVFDYGDPLVTRLGEVWPAAAGMLVLLGLTGWALWRHPRAGFLGAWFFAVLAPTSSIVPVASQTIAEHRLYLPLAALVVAAVWALHRWRPGRSGLVAAVIVTAALGAATHLRNRDYASAVAIWTQTVRARPENPRAHNNLGVVLQQRGDLAAAARHYETAVRLRPDYSDAHNNLGQIHFTAGRFAEALVHFEAAVAAKPKTVAARLNLGGALAGLGRTDEAEAQYRRALGLDPASALAHYQLGNFLLRTDRPEAAVEQFAAAVRLDPAHLDALANQGQALLLLGRNAAALPVLEAWRRQAPADAEVRVHLANALARLGRPAEALQELDGAVRLQPARVETRLAQAQLLLQLGRTEAALELYRAAVQSQPDHLDAQLAYAQALLALGRGREALDRCDAALRLDPDSPLAHFHRGNALLQLGDLPGAIGSFRNALRADPASAAAHHNLAVALMRDRRAGEARPHLEAYLRLEPDSAVGHYNYGATLQQLGETEAAKAALRQALRLRPEFPEARVLLDAIGR